MKKRSVFISIVIFGVILSCGLVAEEFVIQKKKKVSIGVQREECCSHMARLLQHMGSLLSTTGSTVTTTMNALQSFFNGEKGCIIGNASAETLVKVEQHIERATYHASLLQQELAAINRLITAEKTTA